MIKLGILGDFKKYQKIINILSKSKEFEIIGSYYKKNKEISDLDYLKLIENSDLFYLFEKTSDYQEIITEGLKNSKHLFIENIGQQKVEDLEDLIKIAEESNSIILYNKKEYFSPAILSVKNEINNPLYINIQKKIAVQNHKIEILVFDYLLYSIDLVNTFMNSQIKKIFPTAIAVFNSEPDILSVRIEYTNGTLVNIETEVTKSTESNKINIYQHDKLICVNTVNNKYGISNNKEKIKYQQSKFDNSEVVYSQFLELSKLINNTNVTLYNLTDNIFALSLAYKILNMLKIEKVDI